MFGPDSEPRPTIHTETVFDIDGHIVRLNSAGRALRNGKAIPTLTVDGKEVEVFNYKTDFEYQIIRLILETNGRLAPNNLIDKLIKLDLLDRTKPYEHFSQVKSAIDSINRKTSPVFRIESEQENGTNKRTTAYKLKIGE